MTDDPNDLLRKAGDDGVRALVDRSEPFASESTMSSVGDHDAEAPLASQEAMALDFAKHECGRFCYVEDFGSWMVWKGPHWLRDTTGQAFDRVRHYTRRAAACQTGQTAVRTASAATARGVEALAKVDRRLATSANVWDTHTHLLAVPSGVFDLDDQTLRDGRPEDYLTKCTSISPDLTGQKPRRWTRFLDEITCGDDELAAYLQRVAGYCLSGEVSEHVFFFLFGSGRNGKGTFVSVLSALLGPYATTTNMDLLIEQKHAAHPTEIAKLAGVRLATAHETDANRYWAEGRIKQLTGGDIVSARFMRKDFFDYAPQFKLMVSGNHLPRLRHVDPAMRARLQIIPFEAYFGAPDKGLAADLIGEEGGLILDWALDGYKLWKDIGLAPPDKVLSATQSYFADNVPFMSWLRACCIENVNAKLASADAWSSWEAWSTDNDVPKGSRKRLAEDMKRQGFSADRLSADTRGFKGLCLKAEGEP